MTSTLAVFGIEHIIVALIIVVRLVFDKTPNWVNTFFARQRYQKEAKAIAKLKAQKIGQAIFRTFMTQREPAAQSTIQSDLNKKITE